MQSYGECAKKIGEFLGVKGRVGLVHILQCYFIKCKEPFKYDVRAVGGGEGNSNTDIC